MKAESKKNSKKIIIGVLSVCVIAALGVGGTLAFLTDSEQKTNTFSMGDLDITLREPHWDDDGDGDGDEDNVDDDKDPDNGDGRDLKPGDTREKDPTVEAVKGDSYMRVVMVIKDTSGDEPTVITNQERLELILSTIRYCTDGKINKDGHYLLEDIEGIDRVNPKFEYDEKRSTGGTYFYNYKGKFQQGDKAVLFTHIVIPGDWKKEQVDLAGNYQIVIQAQAIQWENIGDSETAFELLDDEIADGAADSNYGVVSNSSDKEFSIVSRSMIA